MGTQRSRLAGFVVSVNIRHLLAATGVVNAQHFLKPDLISGLTHPVTQVCVLLCGKLSSALAWLKRDKIFNIRKNIILSRETTLQHRPN